MNFQLQTLLLLIKMLAQKGRATLEEPVYICLHPYHISTKRLT